MGIHINLAMVMQDWSRRHGLAGPSLTLGVQDLGFSRVEYEAAVATLKAAAMSNEAAMQSAPSTMTADELFTDLGLAPLTAMDISDYEGADIIFDLNEPLPPPETRRRFGVIVNGGTLEHVFHVPNALANMNAMLRPGGAILHVLPCNNWVNHGFYQFSPTLMFDYYAALQFEVLESAMMIFDPRVRSGHYWEIRPAPLGVFGAGLAGALDERTYLHVVLVRHGAASFERAVPVQSLYAGRIVRPKGGPRWFPAYDLSYGTRIGRPNRQILELRHFVKGEGLSWSAHIPTLENYSDNVDDPVRSPVVLLEDACALGPPHALHTAIRAQGGGAFSHWGEHLLFSTSDGTDPNRNGRSYIAILPHSGAPSERTTR